MSYQNLSVTISDKDASFYKDGKLVVLVSYLGRPGKTEYGERGGAERWLAERVGENNLEKIVMGYGCYDTILGIALLAASDPNYKLEKEY